MFDDFIVYVPCYDKEKTSRTVNPVAGRHSLGGKPYVAVRFGVIQDTLLEDRLLAVTLAI
jgi:hypothetical protein